MKLIEDHPDEADESAIRAEIERLNEQVRKRGQLDNLANSLLASFVRPKHPEVSAIAREAATVLGHKSGDPSFGAFQIKDVAQAEQRVDAVVESIYDTLSDRSIAYSDPPPGWDYRGTGQRIRDHAEVAKGGLGTCMDTTVLTAAVIEQVGLLPVLVLVPGHIFIGYWRRTPVPEGRPKPAWYPDTPVITDLDIIQSLLDQKVLGFIETTTFTAGKGVSASDARAIANGAVQRHLFDARNWDPNSDEARDYVELIDVVAARKAGVSSLPAIHRRADGVTEIVDYQPGGPVTVVAEVEPESQDPESLERQIDSHPPRYRTWKSSLFTMNATNDLLNLKRNARVQPLVLPPEGLGLLEDGLNQDATFSLHSGYDIPEVWQARDVQNALQLLGSEDPADHRDLISHLADGRVYVQRIGRSGGKMTALPPSTFLKEIRSMAHHAKTSRDERGMNPLFLCLGFLRWPHKAGVLAEAPLILVPVDVAVARGRHEVRLSLDASQHTTPNAALIEWLRREHSLTIPGLAEPLADRAGIDVDGVLADVRNSVAERGLPFVISAEARIATLDLSAFRMWQDLDHHADTFIGRPLVQHLVHTPTVMFRDPAIGSDDEVALTEDLEELETPIPADSTQKRAVVWARQGRTFVLQGPPGTGKSQTITNMVAECILSGMRVLFVARRARHLRLCSDGWKRSGSALSRSTSTTKDPTPSWFVLS